MQGMPSGQAGQPEALGPLPDEVYALRGAAFAERMGLASAAPGALGGGFSRAGSASQGGCAGVDSRRAERVRRALCEYGRGSSDGGFAGQLRFPAYRVDAMLAIMVGAGQGYTSDSDLMAATGLGACSAERALGDCKRNGLLQEICLSDGCWGWAASEAGIMAMQFAQDALA